MKTNIKNKLGSEDMTRKAGSALVIVMCFSAILLLTGIALHRMSTQLAFTVGNFRKGAQALAVAEAGVSDALDKLSSDFETYKSSTTSNNLADGSYVVTVTTNGKTGAIIASAGTYAGTTRETVLETLGTWQSAWDTNLFSNYGILSDGNSELSGGDGEVKASMYANGSTAIKPNVTVQYSVYAVGIIDNKGTVGGSTNANASEVEIPTFSFEYYKNLAQADGLYYNADKDFKNATYSPNNGIIFVEGNVTVFNSATIGGAIIASGNINILGGTFSNPAGTGLPSLLSAGNIDINGGHKTFNGFIYADGNVDIKGDNTIYGGIIADGNVAVQGNWTIYPGDGTIPPGINPAEGGSVTRIRIGAWLR